MGFVLWTHVVLIALYRGEATAVIPLTLWLLVGWAATEHNTKLLLLFHAATVTAVRHRASVIDSVIVGGYVECVRSSIRRVMVNR